MIHRAFTLIEMLMASVLAAVLLAATLSVSASIARDRKILAAHHAQQNPTAILDLLRRDLINSETMEATSLIGHAGIDPHTLMVTGRLTRLSYLIVDSKLLREQVYLDDPIHPQRWTEVVATDIRRFFIVPASAETENIGVSTQLIPQRVRVRIESDADVVDEVLWVK